MKRRPFGRGRTTILRRHTNHGYEPLTSSPDDPPYSSWWFQPQPPFGNICTRQNLEKSPKIGPRREVKIHPKQHLSLLDDPPKKRGLDVFVARVFWISKNTKNLRSYDSSGLSETTKPRNRRIALVHGRPSFSSTCDHRRSQDSSSPETSCVLTEMEHCPNELTGGWWNI